MKIAVRKKKRTKEPAIITRKKKKIKSGEVDKKW
jgi:hypothetical protein